jgi:hypothetical protein
MTGRVYEIPFSNVTISAAQDIFSVQSTANMAFIIKEIILNQVTAVTIEGWRMTLKRFSGGYSIGSAGTSVTPVKHNFNDAAATVTARANDTTQTSGGTSVIIRADGFNLVNGYQYLAIPEDEINIAPSQAFVLSLDSTPAAGRVVNGTMLVKELF